MTLHLSAPVSSVWQTRLVTPNKAPGLFDYPILVLLAIFIELSVPLLLWKARAPGAIRWGTDAVVVVIIALSLARIMVTGRIPKGFLYILALSIVGMIVATFEGQAAGATAWGWWVTFRYPFFAVYLALQPFWPKDIAHKFFLFCMGLFGVQVLVQIAQLATGQIAGDDLSGFFGRHGVGPLTMFLFFVLCLAFGKWLADGNFRYVLWMLVLGALSSSMGEMKIFPVGMVLIAAMSLFIYGLRKGDVGRLLRYTVIFTIIPFVFGLSYNVLVADVRGTPRIEEYLNPDKTEYYLSRAKYKEDRGTVQLGRGFAMSYGWELIQRDATTLLFGMGTGARSESVSLGVMGAGILQDNLGLTSSTSILVLTHETGLFGLVTFALFNLLIVARMWKDSRDEPDSPITVLRYGLILFSLLWPLWLWYHQVWVFAVPMMLYWATVGYVLTQAPVRVREHTISYHGI